VLAPQTLPKRPVHRALVHGVIVVCSALVLGCAPDASPIERTSETAESRSAAADALVATNVDTPAGSAAWPAGRRRPDVLLISLDTLRADALSCYGNTRPTSPNIDAFAERGVRFERCYAPAPHTAPSHLSLFSGLLPTAHGVSNTNAQSTRVMSISDDWPLLAEELARAGYQTMFAANRGQLRQAMGFARGIEQFDASTKTFIEVQGVVERMLEDVAPDEPLFAFVHTYEPHAPYLPPRHAQGAPLHGRFTSANYDGVLRARYDQLIERAAEGAGLAQAFYAGAETFTPADVEFLIGLYHENVLWTDMLFARLLATWGSHRDLSNTLVVLVSDHGEQLGERGKFAHAFGLEHELVHVPFIVVGPSIEARVEEEVVSLVAVAAAILEHVGLSPPAHYTRGVRFSGGVSNGAIAHLQDMGRHPSQGVVEGPWQYFRGVRANAAFGDRAYDLASDPRGLVDVELESSVLARLSALVDERDRADRELLRRSPAKNVGTPTPEQLQMLRDLGYTGEGEAEEAPPTNRKGGQRR